GFLEVALRYWSEGCVTTPVGYLEGWYVRPQHRRQGIGSALLAAAEGWARQRSALEMASDTELADADSRRLHREMGYQEVAERVHFRKHLGEIPPGEGGGDGGDGG
ncbi:MAG TPA: GNAT family N-acetyltransferase, partial [Thermoanaerobaculia bacterium]|nr:GNAT family N-acetyltransferase [Thermoanaerobaculia bacterium]